MPYPQQLGRILGPGYNVSNLGNSGKNMLKKGLCGGGGNCCGLPPVNGVSPCTDGRINSKNLCPKCSGDCAYWDQPTYHEAMASEPDIVTIMLGTNDAKGCNWDRTPDGVQGQGKIRQSFPLFSFAHTQMISSCGAGDLFQNDYKDMIEKFRALPSKPKIYVVLPPPLFPPWPYNMSATAVSVSIARSSVATNSAHSLRVVTYGGCALTDPASASSRSCAHGTPTDQRGIPEATASDCH